MCVRRRENHFPISQITCTTLLQFHEKKTSTSLANCDTHGAHGTHKLAKPGDSLIAAEN